MYAVLCIILWLLCNLNCHWSICTMWPYNKQWYQGGVQLEFDIALHVHAILIFIALHVRQRCARTSLGRHSLVNKGQMHSTMTRLWNALFSSILHQFSQFKHRFICFWACPIDWWHAQVSHIWFSLSNVRKRHLFIFFIIVFVVFHKFQC